LKKNRLYIFGFLIVLFTIGSCNSDKEEGVKVASAYDYTLYYSDLAKVIPKGISGNDSLVFVQNYINHWLQQKVLLHFSELNLQEADLNLDQQIENYKNSLLIYHYQKRFVQQNLDTLISDEEISEYYKSHPNDFELKNNIVKVKFIKLEKDSKNIKEARKILKENKPKDIEKLNDLAERYAVNYFLDSNVWILFEDLLKEVPIKTYNHESFLKNNQYFELTDSLYTTLVRINGFKIKESLSPLSFEYERIRMIILNKRKQALVRKLEDDVFIQAQKEGALKNFE